jgi:DNA-binding LacI/PurR family transcriptional regulator
MIAPTNSYYYGEAIEGAKKAAAIAGVRLTLAISEYQPARELQILDRMIDIGLDGVLITPALVPPDDDIRDAIERCPIPVTVVERVWEYPTRDHPVDSVRSDHAHGAEIAVRHLADLGHRRIALWTQTHAHHDEIRNGFVAAVRASGLDVVLSDFDNLHPDWRSDDLPSNARRYLTEINEHGATAVLVYPDDFALAIAQEAGTVGLDVPGDLSVVAYDDEVAGLAQRPLTAVAPPKHAIGFAAIDACLRRTADTGSGARLFPAQRTRLLPTLHIRQSTARPHRDRSTGRPDRRRIPAADTGAGRPDAGDCTIGVRTLDRIGVLGSRS